MTPTNDLPNASNSFDLARFTRAQEEIYTQVLEELQRGHKKSHWMWFIFPQIDGLGRSSIAKHYAIKSLEEAAAYLNHPVLGQRLLQCSETLLNIHGKSASEIFGYPDEWKLRSCMTLFAAIAETESVFVQVLTRYFKGQPDQQTMEILNREPQS
ncbi:MAG: DUF1810 domain-containing protein [Proteobacteria bacterium]|nr:DUF1810 domain-containing protein [Desulfocapsa sp.]MBU3945376.1 DUF1810 domain-containing protein [Pseudomonadota bacterium]MBU3983063.1 DUF1810 domain-containing protein [Pseudomonadota bacterium]MBU4029359.1 DUF1810 domain-containing protein [Pseudomonadota bacterium]MBU4042624.1 DUF1810 domain-containing protein [Pseudomonadota bacterium]